MINRFIVKIIDDQFLNSLTSFLTKQYGKHVKENSLFVTNGNSQALDLVCTMFSKPGDTIFVEEPTYFLEDNIFRDKHLNIVGIPTDDLIIPAVTWVNYINEKNSVEE